MKEEKRGLIQLEENLRKQLARQWSQLRETVTRPILFAFMIHPGRWGHKTRSWKKNAIHPKVPWARLHSPVIQDPGLGIPDRVSPAAHSSTDSQIQPDLQTLPESGVPKPPILPPLSGGDVYENISEVIKFPVDNENDEDDWIVDEEELEDFSKGFFSGEEVLGYRRDDYLASIEQDKFTFEEFTGNQQDESFPSMQQDEFTSMQHDEVIEGFTTSEENLSTTHAGEYQDFSVDKQEVAFNNMSDNLYQYFDHQGNSQDVGEDATESQVQQEVSSYNQEFADFYDTYEEGADYLYYEDYGDEDASEDPDEG